MRRLIATGFVLALTAAGPLGCGSGGKDVPPAEIKPAPAERPSGSGAKEKGAKGAEGAGAKGSETPSAQQ